MNLVNDSIDEYVSISGEINHLRQEIKKLSKRRKQCERDILDYLEETDNPGIKKGQYVFRRMERVNRRINKRSTRQRLLELGLAEKQVEEILKGDEASKTVLTLDVKK